MAAKTSLLNGTDLQDSTYHTTETSALNAPPRSVDVIDIARADYGIQVHESFGSRKFTVEGWLQAATRDLTDTAIDDLKSLLNNRDMEYRLGHAGGYRQWVGTPTNIMIAQKPTQLTVANWSFEYVCAYPFATDGNTDTLVSETGITDGSSEVNVTGTGTYFSIPVIEITINSIDPDDTETQIIIANPLLDRYLTIPGTFTAGDVLEIDCVNGTVFQGSTLLDVEGQFPIWKPGGGTFEYSDTADSRNVDIEASHERRFI